MVTLIGASLSELHVVSSTGILSVVCLSSYVSYIDMFHIATCALNCARQESILLDPQRRWERYLCKFQGEHINKHFGKSTKVKKAALT